MPRLLLRAGPTDLRAKTGFLHKSGMLAFAWGSQPIEAAHQMWQNLKAGDRKACIMRALIWEMGARNGA